MECASFNGFLQRKLREQYVYRRRGERYIPTCIDERDRHGCGIAMIWGRVESPLMPKPPFIQPREVLLPMPTPIKLWILMYCFLMPIKGLLFSKMVLTFTLSEQPYALAFEKPRSQYELNHHLIVYSYSFIVRNISVLPTASMCVALCIHLCMNHSLSDLTKSCKVKMRGVTLV